MVIMPSLALNLCAADAGTIGTSTPAATREMSVDISPAV
jgi:hypothetical protein